MSFCSCTHLNVSIMYVLTLPDVHATILGYICSGTSDSAWYANITRYDVQVKCFRLVMVKVVTTVSCHNHQPLISFLTHRPWPRLNWAKPEPSKAEPSHAQYSMWRWSWPWTKFRLAQFKMALWLSKDREVDRAGSALLQLWCVTNPAIWLCPKAWVTREVSGRNDSIVCMSSRHTYFPFT